MCGGVGLLGGDAAVLELEIGGVAGCVDPFEAAHLAVLIDGDEAVGRLGQAGQGWALELGERDHPIEVAAPVPRADLDHAASAHVEAGGSEHLDIAIGEQPGDGLAGAGAEDRKQRVLGCHDRDRSSVFASYARAEVISASSYTGNGQATRGATTNASRLMHPPSTS